MHEDAPTASAAPSSELVFEDALDRVREELLALDPAVVVAINVDVSTAVHVVLGAAHELREHRPALARWFGEEMACTIDRLELLAHAARHAHSDWLIEPEVDVTALSGPLGEMRALLASEARSLVLRGLVPREKLTGITKGFGHVKRAFDVLQLASIFRSGWAQLSGKTGVTPDELERAERLAALVVEAVGRRDEALTTPAEDLRRRAFALLAETYDDARRMLSFLRWKEGDADEIAPPLRAGGRGKKRARGAATAPGGGPPAETAPGVPGASPFRDG